MQTLPIISLPDPPSNPEPTWFGSDPIDWHSFEVAGRTFVLVADRSQIFEVDSDAWSSATGGRSGPTEAVLAKLGIVDTAAIDDQPPQEPPLRSLSLAVAQKCNLGCTYCYAQEGDFGGAPKMMPLAVALAAVDRLFAESSPGDRVNLSFLGGEPLLARNVVREATLKAVELATVRGVRVGFSITSNGTLLTPGDADFFNRHGFAVTVSIDGIGQTHDQLAAL